MTELSQAERTEVVARVLWEYVAERVGIVKKASWTWLSEDRKQPWIADARIVLDALGDYGRERERALLGALETARRRIRQMHEAGFDSRRREIATDAICEIDDALAASPGELEGQPCSHCHGDRVLMEPDGSKVQPCLHCQPDHGPGEPSDGKLREALVLMAMAHEGSLIDEALFEERYHYLDRGLIEAVRMAPTEDYEAHLTKAGLEFIRTALAGESNE